MSRDPRIELSASAVFSQLNTFVVPLVKAGWGSPLPVGSGMVLLVTTGRVSGEPREVPVSALRLGSKIIVATVRSNSQWFKNLQADPRATIWVGGRGRQAMARLENHHDLNLAILTLDEDDPDGCATED